MVGHGSGLGWYRVGCNRAHWSIVMYVMVIQQKLEEGGVQQHRA